MDVTLVTKARDALEELGKRVEPPLNAESFVIYSLILLIDQLEELNRNLRNLDSAILNKRL